MTGQAPNEKPQFDYSNYSRKQQKRLTRLQFQVQRLATKLDEQGADMPDEAYDAALDELDVLIDKLERMALAQVTNVPRGWLVQDAPEDLTCQSENWWDWLRADRLEALKEAAVDARSPEAVSGN